MKVKHTQFTVETSTPETIKLPPSNYWCGLDGDYPQIKAGRLQMMGGWRGTGTLVVQASSSRVLGWVCGEAPWTLDLILNGDVHRGCLG